MSAIILMACRLSRLTFITSTSLQVKLNCSPSLLFMIKLYPYALYFQCLMQSQYIYCSMVLQSYDGIIRKKAGFYKAGGPISYFERTSI
jgi:hypothetical protein